MSLSPIWERKSSLLEIQSIKVSYSGALALKGVSVSVPEGHAIAIVGANGAGKTTLLNTISGILNPSSGQILWQGKNLIKMTANEITTSGIVQVPEGRKLFYRMTVRENLLIGGSNSRAKSERPQKLKAMYELFPILSERRSQLAGALSGGEQQMLAIARGLMACPKLLMLDEPSLGLAPLIVKEIFSTIQKLNGQGLSIILVEQNIVSSLKICHYGYVIENGQVVLEGKGDELLRNEHTKKAYMGV